MQNGDIRFYDEHFNLLCIVSRYLSVNWQTSFKGYGIGELHLPKTAEYVELLTKYQRLFVQQNDFQGVVTGIRIEKDCGVFLKTPEWLLTKFIAEEYKAAQGDTAGSVACALVERALGGRISLVTTGAEQDTTDCTDFTLEEATDLYSAVLTCLTNEKTGFSFPFNTEEKSFTFAISAAKENTGAVFGAEYKSYTDEVYVRDDQNRAEGYVFYQKVECGGNYDPVNNDPALRVQPENYGVYYRITETGERFGLELKEGDIIICKRTDGKFEKVKEAKPFPVLKETQDTGIFGWSAVLSVQTEDEAARALEELKSKTTISGTAKAHAYGTDYTLGDVVTVQFSAEGYVYVEKKIVSGVHVFEDAQTFGCVPEFTALTQTEE